MIERMIGLQGSIFDLAEECAPGPLDGMQRTELTRGAWVDHLPGWVQGSGQEPASSRQPAVRSGGTGSEGQDS